MRQLLSILLLGAVLAYLPACQSIYYSAMEVVGKQKRDLLVEGITEVRDQQQEAKKEFKDALDQFSKVTNFKGGELEERYNKLSSQYDTCKSRSEDVAKQIKETKRVAADLFKEWTKELEQYSSADLRSASEKQLRETQQRYELVVSAMERAESKMNKVLVAFNDQVLFLKHNLNAQAIASLSGVSATLEKDVAALIKEMEASIQEADTFISSMSK